MKKKVKLELVQYPYSKSGPTLYLNDEKIGGPKAFGVGRTIYSFEVDPNELMRICEDSFVSLEDVMG